MSAAEALDTPKYDDPLDYADDPEAFCHDILGEDITAEDVIERRAYAANAPWGRQVEVMESVRDYKRTTVRAGHNVGKTHIAARVGLWFLLTHYPSAVITTAPRLVQVRDQFWMRYRQAYKRARVELSPQGPLTMSHYPMPGDPEWFAKGFTSKEPEGFQGYHELYLLFILDEGPGVPAFVWGAVEGSLSNEGARLLTIGNPVSRSGPFFQSTRDSDVNVIHISCWDHPNVVHGRSVYPMAIAPSWPAERKAKWGEDSPLYQSRVCGNFPTEDEDTLIPLAWVEAAVNRVVNITDGPTTAGVDVARFGLDDTTGYRLRNRRAEKAFGYTGKGLDETEGHTRRLCRDCDLVAIDDAGLGGGVVDGLTGKTVAFPASNLIPFNAGWVPTTRAEKDEKAKRSSSRRRILGRRRETVRDREEEEDFANLGSEMAWALRELFRETYLTVESGVDDPNVGISIEDDDDLKVQLTSRKYSFNRLGQIVLESKDDFKAREPKIGSPDEFDALMHAWYARLEYFKTRNHRASVRSTPAYRDQARERFRGY